MKDRYYGKVRREIFPLLPKATGRLLDLGGGYGGTSSQIKREGLANFVVLADLVADNHDPDIDVAYSGDLEDLKFLRGIIQQQGPFDTVLCLDVLEHLRDPWSVVEELFIGLRPGGVIVTSIPNMRHVKLILPLIFKGKFELKDSNLMDRTHLRWFVRDSAIDLMTKPGMNLERIEGRRSGKRWHKWADRLSFGLLRDFFTIQYLIVVRKPAST